MIKDYKKRLLICAIIILLGIALDQYIKWLCVKHLKPIGSVPFIRHVLQFTYVENRGAAFGMLQNQRWVFMVVSVLILVATIRERKLAAQLAADETSGKADGGYY